MSEAVAMNTEKSAQVVREILMGLVNEGYDFGPIKRPSEYIAKVRVFAPGGDLFEIGVFQVSPSGGDA